jgi:DNA-binding response OmpR family regulator
MTNILIVEDEPDVAELVYEALVARGFNVTLAMGDQAALDHLDRDAAQFGVLVADINLGTGVTGFDIARRARQLNRTIKVIYITGHAAHLGRFGVDEALMFPKPFDATELALQVEALLAA